MSIRRRSRDAETRVTSTREKEKKVRCNKFRLIDFKANGQSVARLISIRVNTGGLFLFFLYLSLCLAAIIINRCIVCTGG